MKLFFSFTLLAASLWAGSPDVPVVTAEKRAEFWRLIAQAHYDTIQFSNASQTLQKSNDAVALFKMQLCVEDDTKEFHVNDKTGEPECSLKAKEPVKPEIKNTDKKDLK